MTRDELLLCLRTGTEGRWHWWSWHFQAQLADAIVPFTSALLDALLVVDAAMPGYAVRMTDAICSYGGRKKHEPDYEQLLQLLAEIHVAAYVTSRTWPVGTGFADEPQAPGSRRNPELVVSAADWRLGVEVKAPALLQHQALRGSRPLQAGGRLFTPQQLEAIAGGGDRLTLSRDNPVKDFLLSADAKFAGFRAADPSFFGVLVIVWDDFVYEPITALLHPASGLLTPNSFARSDEDEPIRYPNVDAIAIVSHLQWLKRALGEDGGRIPLAVGHRAFEWNLDLARPAALVESPDGRGLPEGVGELLDLRPLETIPGAEYRPKDLINWIDLGA